MATTTTQHPWRHLLGVATPDSAEFRELVARLRGPPEEKAFRDCKYVNYRRDGVSFCFDRVPGTPDDGAASGYRLGAIHLFNQGVDRYDKCTLAPLPYGLSLDQSNVQVVTMLGEPTKKSGGKVTAIVIDYEPLGVQIRFRGRSWDDLQNVIDEITLYAPVPSAAQTG